MPSLPTCSRSAHEGRMANEELHRLIAGLHDALERTRELDDESRRLLQQVASDLSRLAPAGQGSDGPGSDGPGSDGPGSDGPGSAGSGTARVDDVAAATDHAPLLEGLAVRLESRHPAVSAAVRSLVDSLARAGV